MRGITIMKSARRKSVPTGSVSSGRRAAGPAHRRGPGGRGLRAERQEPGAHVSRAELPLARHDDLLFTDDGASSSAGPERYAVVVDGRLHDSVADDHFSGLMESMARTLPISEVKTHLPELVTGVADREEEVIVTRKGKPAAVLVNFAEYERLKASLDVLSDPDLVARVRERALLRWWGAWSVLRRGVRGAARRAEDATPFSGPFRLDIPPHVAERIRTLPPEVKQGVKHALRLLSSDPAAGEPLRGQLEGYWKYRVRRYRVVYRPMRRADANPRHRTPPGDLRGGRRPHPLAGELTRVAPAAQPLDDGAAAPDARDCSRLRSIHAVFSCICVRSVRRSIVGWSSERSASGNTSRAVRTTVSWPSRSCFTILLAAGIPRSSLMLLRCAKSASLPAHTCPARGTRSAKDGRRPQLVVLLLGHGVHRVSTGRLRVLRP